jgi:hypothetical protein
MTTRKKLPEVSNVCVFRANLGSGLVKSHFGTKIDMLFARIRIAGLPVLLSAPPRDWISNGFSDETSSEAVAAIFLG